MKKFLFACLILVVALGIIVISAKNAIAKAAIENGVRIATGLSLEMRKFDFSLTKSYVRIEDLKLHNPRGYADAVMADLPEVYVNYELAPLLGNRLHFEELRLYLKEFVVVKDEKGRLNLDALKPVKAAGGGTGTRTQPGPAGEARPEKKPSAPAKKTKAPQVKIDNLSLRIEKVIFKDYTQSTPSVREFNVRINERYENIENLNYVVSLIVLKIMMTTPLAALTHFDMGALPGGVADALSTSTQFAGEAASGALAAGEKAKAQLEQADLGGAIETLKGARKEIKGLFSGFKDEFSSPLTREEKEPEAGKG